MKSPIIMVLYLSFQILNFAHWRHMENQYGIVPASAISAILFLVSSIIPGKLAARQLIWTYEDQERARRSKQ